MKIFVKSFLLATLFCLANNFLVAQYTFDYMKVKPGMHKEYLSLEKVWKKIHQANIKAGKYQFWELLNVAYPSGDNEEYNYVTRINFKDAKQLAEYHQNWTYPDLTKILTLEELALVARTDEIRTRVKSEVWSHKDFAAGKDIDKEKIVVFNFFTFPKTGSQDKHLQVEREIWKPIHEARIKDGNMIGWGLITKMLPWSTAETYYDATVDLYADWEQFLKSQQGDSYFKKVHPGKDADKLFAETLAACDLIRQEVREVIDNSNMTDEATVKK